MIFIQTHREISLMLYWETWNISTRLYYSLRTIRIHAFFLAVSQGGEFFSTIYKNISNHNTPDAPRKKQPHSVLFFRRFLQHSRHAVRLEIRDFSCLRQALEVLRCSWRSLPAMRDYRAVRPFRRRYTQLLCTAKCRDKCPMHFLYT